MAASIQRRRRIAGFWLGLLLAVASLCAAADSLTWHKDQNRVDADLHGWPLPKLLEEIAEATGWQVYVEPGSDYTASTKFKDLPVPDALRLLLGNLNFALVPQTNAQPRLFVFKTSMRGATRLVRPALKVARTADAKIIPNELIVRLKPGAKIDDIARQLGAKVIGRIDSLNAYLLKFDSADAADAARTALSSNSDVASVDFNYSIDRPPTPQLVPGASALPPSLQLKPPGSDGRLIVGLVDTPLQSLGPALDAFLFKSISLAGDAQPDPNSPTHATSMFEAMLTGIQSAAGGSSSAQILHVDVYGNNPTTTTWDIALGIVQAINGGANLVNVSSGATVDSSFLSGSSWFADIIQQASDKGIVIFAAAGNTHDASPVLPAALPGVTAVTASDGQGNLASYANYANYVKLMTPGALVVNFHDQSYLVVGTSVSSALASGIATGLAETGNKGLSAVDTAMQNSPAFKVQLPPSPSNSKQ
jgi:hypothetical protein